MQLNLALHNFHLFHTLLILVVLILRLLSFLLVCFCTTLRTAPTVSSGVLVRSIDTKLRHETRETHAEIGKELCGVGCDRRTDARTDGIQLLMQITRPPRTAFI